MALTTYRKKRRFDRTPEPSGAKSPARRGNGKLAFVVQKHDATRLHYDFRLELDGTMKSWAVPKGPSLDPQVKRLAVHVEDHPIEYNAFEGVIPEGEYGGGPVLIWDRGRWVPEEDPRAGYKKGVLKFRLEGEKLHGSWALVRTKGLQGRKEQWLLIKHKDEAARRGAKGDIVDAKPRSVVSNRTIRQIRPPEMPDALEPVLATLVDAAPQGKGWLSEIKYDGYRALARIEKGKARIFTRRGNDWTEKFASIARDAGKLRVKEAWLDGEIVALGKGGISSFGALQQALGAKGGGDELVYFVFDLPWLDGRDLRDRPLTERKAALRKLLGKARGRIRYSDHVDGHAAAFFEKACESGLEGIVCKNAQSAYRAGRGRDWLKVKCVQTRDLVIVGYTEPKGSRSGFGALVLGEAAGLGQLTHAGRVGTGFDEAAIADLMRKLRKIEVAKPPVSPAPRGAAARGVHWVKPTLVAEVAFTEKTRDGILRHPVYRGLREDKSPRETAGEAKGTDMAAVEGVRLTNPDKVLYPDAGVTKRMLVDYYVEVEERLMPYVKDRPLTLVRCPDGYKKFCFFQKHFEGEPPAGISTMAENYFYATSLRGVLETVQLGALELHVWGSHARTVERPDLMIFDLDPDAGLPWARVVEAGRTMHARLTELGLTSWLKTTGGKGIHVCVPLGRRQDWDEVKAFAKALAEDVVRREPTKYTANQLKVKRKGRIFLDYLRNGRGATAVAAWSSRARAGAPVSMPLDWSELDAKLDPARFTVETAGRRLRGKDPWSGFYACRQTITASMRRALSERT